MVYFDNAATTFPKPAAVKNAVDLAILRYGANPGRSGHDLSTETARQVYCVREKVAAFFGAEDAGQVVFTQNCTYALNTAIKGLVRPGGKIIIPTYINMSDGGNKRAVRLLEAAGVNFKRQFNIDSYRKFFGDAGYKNVEYSIIDGRIPCAVAVITKQ